MAAERNLFVSSPPPRPLYLSGTPFRAITNGEFTEDAVFNWTYVDEQREKQNWDNAVGPNPYLELPAMEMYSYQIGQGAAWYAEDGEFSGFSLSEYFKAKKVDSSSRATGIGAYVFADPERVSEFLEMLRGKLRDQMKMQVVAGQKAPSRTTIPASPLRCGTWSGICPMSPPFAMTKRQSRRGLLTATQGVVACQDQIHV